MALDVEEGRRVVVLERNLEAVRLILANDQMQIASLCASQD
jgi:hypothetical protein